MAHVLQRHRHRRQIGDIHGDIKQRARFMQRDRRLCKVVIAKTHHILIAPTQTQRVAVKLQPRLIHRGAGHFAVQRVSIFR